VPGASGTVYLAGPITGETFESANWWRTAATLPLEEHGWRVLSPLRGKAKFVPNTGTTVLSNDFDGDREAFSRDTFDIDRSDVGIWNFDGAKRVSIGSVAEIGYAYARAKHIVVCTGDDEIHSEHLFIRNMASIMVPTLDDALHWIMDL
jgi:nucleoside 2-deoxyribosyltransferase